VPAAFHVLQGEELEREASCGLLAALFRAPGWVIGVREESRRTPGEEIRLERLRESKEDPFAWRGKRPRKRAGFCHELLQGELHGNAVEGEHLQNVRLLRRTEGSFVLNKPMTDVRLTTSGVTELGYRFRDAPTPTLRKEGVLIKKKD